VKEAADAKANPTAVQDSTLKTEPRRQQLNRTGKTMTGNDDEIDAGQKYSDFIKAKADRAEKKKIGKEIVNEAEAEDNVTIDTTASTRKSVKSLVAFHAAKVKKISETEAYRPPTESAKNKKMGENLHELLSSSSSTSSSIIPSNSPNATLSRVTVQAGSGGAERRSPSRKPFSLDGKDNDDVNNNDNENENDYSSPASSCPPVQIFEERLSNFVKVTASVVTGISVLPPELQITEGEIVKVANHASHGAISGLNKNSSSSSNPTFDPPSRSHPQSPAQSQSTWYEDDETTDSSVAALDISEFSGALLETNTDNGAAKDLSSGESGERADMSARVDNRKKADERVEEGGGDVLSPSSSSADDRWNKSYSQRYSRWYWKDKSTGEVSWKDPAALSQEVSKNKDTAISLDSSKNIDKPEILWVEKYSKKYERKYWKNILDDSVVYKNPFVDQR